MLRKKKKGYKQGLWWILCITIGCFVSFCGKTIAFAEELPKEVLQEEEILPKSENLKEEGTLSKPENLKEEGTVIFVGDSRTVGMCDAVSDDNIWSCKSGMGYAWMSSTGVPQIEEYIGKDTSIVIWMGVNDVSQISNYVSYVNVKANEWEALGATTYYVSLGPVEQDPYVTNEEIEQFNEILEKNLLGVQYIDVYSYLKEIGFSTTDGIHYPDSVSEDIYEYILENLEESGSSSIWG